jgi:uncharacterized protein (DUF1778 family)
VFSPVRSQKGSHRRQAVPSDCLGHQIKDWPCDLAELLAEGLDGSLERCFPRPQRFRRQFQIPSAGPYVPALRKLQFDGQMYVRCVYSMAMATDQSDASRRPKSGRLGLRTTDWQRSILAAASRAEGSTVSEFVLKYATRAAEEVLADRRAFVLSEPQWTAFADALDRPPRSFLRLRNLMVTAEASTSTNE